MVVGSVHMQPMYGHVAGNMHGELVFEMFTQTTIRKIKNTHTCWILASSAPGKDQIENSPQLWANEEVGCKSKKFKKSREEWQESLAEMEKNL